MVGQGFILVEFSQLIDRNSLELHLELVLCVFVVNSQKPSFVLFDRCMCVELIF